MTATLTGEPAERAAPTRVAVVVPRRRTHLRYVDVVRVLTVAPGLFETPMGAGAPPEVKAMLIATLEFPKRMGMPKEFANLVAHLVENSYLNGELIRIDAGTRAPPR